METIRNYLNNMFAGLPKTQQMDDLRNNMLSNMEDKYNELKSEGKSENEAIGIVISEFGNIDELINELGIQKKEETNADPMVSREEVDSYLSVKKTMGIQIGIGVMLCILSPAPLIIINYLIESGIMKMTGNIDNFPGLVSLFVMVAMAVGMFIYSGTNFERYKYMEEGVSLPTDLKTELQRSYDSFLPTYNLITITGVCLLILSPLAIFITNYLNDDAIEYGVAILLCIVAFSVFLFITSGQVREGYGKLLKIGDYTETHKKENKVIGAVASFVWPLASLIFLFCGFVFHIWNIAWIVFPLTGILFGMFCAVYSNLTKEN